MDKEKLKNIVVLKNLPSNLVDEAIVILKPNKKIRKLELIDKNKSTKINNKETKDNTHVINEAEMLVNSFISEIEKAETNSNSNDKLKEKYNRLKKYALLSTMILMMSVILHFV